MDTRIFVRFFIFASLVTTVISCASFGTPTGGPPDKDAPIMDLKESEVNYQINFAERKFELFFDEFIEVKNISKQLIVSPPLLYKPIVEARGKRISFEFNEKEILKEDATYVINFGESIQDFRAGNVLKNFTFVFSTGDKIDSLSTNGFVKDAYDSKPLENIVVALYDEFSDDSTVVKSRPFYLAKTDKNGKYVINNIKADTFLIIAFEDLNLNLKYDELTEKIGFIDSLLFFNDSSIIATNLELSIKEKTPKFLKNVSYLKGLVHLLYDARPLDIKFEPLPKNIIKYNETIGDTLIYYYKYQDSFELFNATDTIFVKEKESFKSPILLINTSNNSKSGLSLKDSFLLQFNYPIDSVFYKNILLNDSTSISENEILFLENKFYYKSNFKQDSSYTLTFLPRSFVDIYGNENDTIVQKFNVLNNEKLGTINLTIDSLKQEYNYDITLEINDKIIKNVNLSGVENAALDFGLLPPGKYKVRILEDKNNDKKWSSSNYWNKTQAEKIKLYNLEDLRANWELQDNINWNASKNIDSKN
jgi:hypothetical protein